MTIRRDEVEALLAGRWRGLQFPPHIEAAFLRRTRKYRSLAMRAAAVGAIIPYNVFLLADYLLLPDTFWLAAALHFLVVTPIILLATWLLWREPRFLVRELSAAAIPVAMVAQIMLVYALNEGPEAQHYQYLALTVPVYMAVNLRPDFRVAVAAAVVILAIYVAGLLAHGAPAAAFLVGCATMASAASLSLTANWRMERDRRHAFLRRLADEHEVEGARETARRDPLTGLSNRLHLDEVVSRLREHGAKQVAVVMIDVDHFKPFNDRYGHVAGDLCLRRVAAAISAELRSEDDVAVRYGGEEFLVLLPERDISEAVRIAERIRRAVSTLAIPHDGAPLGVVTASLGVIGGPLEGTSIAELVSGADGALYAAKRNGRNQVWPPFLNRAEAARGAASALRPAVG